MGLLIIDKFEMNPDYNQYAEFHRKLCYGMFTVYNPNRKTIYDREVCLQSACMSLEYNNELKLFENLENLLEWMS